MITISNLLTTATCAACKEIHVCASWPSSMSSLYPLISDDGNDCVIDTTLYPIGAVVQSIVGFEIIWATVHG